MQMNDEAAVCRRLQCDSMMSACEDGGCPLWPEAVEKPDFLSVPTAKFEANRSALSVGKFQRVGLDGRVDPPRFGHCGRFLTFLQMLPGALWPPQD
jgi:hypothetical protein